MRRVLCLAFVFCVSLATVGCCPPSSPTKLTVKIKTSTWETDRGTDYTNLTDEHDRTIKLRGTHDLKPGKTYEIDLSDGCNGGKRVKAITETNKPQVATEQVIKIQPSDKEQTGPRTFRVTVGSDGKVVSEEIPDEQVKLLKDSKK